MQSENNLHVIVGLGKSGLSCVRFLRHRQVPVAVTDSRMEPPGLVELQRDFPEVKTSLGQFDTALMAQAHALVVSPGVPLREPAIAQQIARGLVPIGDIELFARYTTKPVVAITGTNGKSTVTTLVGAMAEYAGRCVQVGGNLGTPALDLIVDPEPELYVLELSSFQLETTYSLRPAAAVVLNITPDHMDRYQDLAEYVAAKQRIYQHCKIAVINREDTLSYSGLPQNNNVISFGLDQPVSGQFGLVQHQGKDYLALGDELLLATDELQIKGSHQIGNALAALALGHAVGLPMPAMLQCLRAFRGLAHRCQWVAKTAGVDWYNDSKGTNVYSSLAAIVGLGRAVTGKLILLAGGLGKHQDFSPLRDPVSQYVRAVVLFGQDAQEIAAHLAVDTPQVFADSMQDAVKKAQQLAQPGDAVLLSPACASFDMFKNFEHRGDVFMECVKALSVTISR